MLSYNLEISKALKDLETNFMTMDDLKRAGETGELIIEKGIWGYDYKFQQLYPNHPMSAGRYKRIKAADAIRDIAKKIMKSFSDEILRKLHIFLFDCCATVRLSLAEALYYAGNSSSIPYLKDLVESENESKMVLDQAKESLDKLKLL